MNLTDTERYLAEFHDTKPGTTSRAFAALSVLSGTRSFASTYHALAAALPAGQQSRTVLDLACGDGHLLALLAESTLPQTLIGVDLSAGELRVARARLAERATLYLAKAQQLPLAADTVDVAVSHLALMLMDDADTVVAELCRVLRPGGTLAAVVCTRSPPGPVIDAFMRLYPSSSRREAFAGIRFGDRRFGSRHGIVELLEAGFDPPVFETLSVSRQLTPAQLWDWFDDMYDTDLLTPSALATFRHEFLQALLALCSPSGTVQHEDRYLLFSARARA